MNHESAVPTRPMRIPATVAPLLLLCLATACSELTKPQQETQGSPKPEPVEKTGDAREVKAKSPPDRGDRPARPNDEEKVEASHILISHKDAPRARVTRTKEEARKLAEQVLAEVKKGGDFGQLAAKYSDDPGSKQREGKLGSFSRRRMVKPFADAAFALKPGETSDLVETPFGYHIIKRTK